MSDATPKKLADYPVGPSYDMSMVKDHLWGNTFFTLALFNAELEQIRAAEASPEYSLLEEACQDAIRIGERDPEVYLVAVIVSGDTYPDGTTAVEGSRIWQTRAAPDEAVPTEDRLKVLREFIAKHGRFPGQIEYDDDLGLVPLGGEQCDCTSCGSCELQGLPVGSNRRCYLTMLADYRALLDEQREERNQKQRLLTKVPLYTSKGEHVIDVYVSPFTCWPQMLVWGQRTFVRPNFQDVGGLSNAPPKYYEVTGVGAFSGDELAELGIV